MWREYAYSTDLANMPGADKAHLSRAKTDKIEKSKINKSLSVCNYETKLYFAFKNLDYSTSSEGCMHVLSRFSWLKFEQAHN